MKINEDARIDVISAISDEHIEAVTIERAEAKGGLKRRRRTVGAVSALAACFIIIIQGVLLVALGLPFGGRAPIYEGMTVSDVNPIETAYSYGNYKDTGFRLAYLSSAKKGGKKPISEGVKEHFGVTAGELLYYAKPNEDIYITVKINNPENYEILSFTLNGKKYSSYMFETGSDMSNIVLKVNVGDVTGRISYTIDAIKYVDGDRIKDVRMEGERTVEIGIYNENQPTASVEDVNIGYDSLSFNAFVSDPEGLISATGGVTYAVLYDGDGQLMKREISLGSAASVSFEGLVPNTEYQYAVVAVYDAYDGEGRVSHILAEGSFSNNPEIIATEIQADSDKVSFLLTRHNGVGELVRIEVVNEDGEVVLSSDTEVTELYGVPGGRHSIKVVYAYYDGTARVVAESQSEPFLCRYGNYPVVGIISVPHAVDEPFYNHATGGYSIHSGVDFVTTTDDLSVYCVSDGGVVSDVYTDSFLGRTVKIVDENNFTYLYQSMGAVYVSIGDTVERGEVIGTVGDSSMREMGVHLHFTVENSQGVAVDPEFIETPAEKKLEYTVAINENLAGADLGGFAEGDGSSELILMRLFTNVIADVSFSFTTDSEYLTIKDISGRPTVICNFDEIIGEAEAVITVRLECGDEYMEIDATLTLIPLVAE